MRAMYWLLFGGLVALLAVSCDRGPEGDAEPVEYGRLRIVQLAPNDSALQVWLDDESLGSAGYLSLSGYFRLADGNHRFSVGPVLVVPPQMIVDVILPVEGNKNYSCVVSGIPGDYAALLLEDTTVSPGTQCRVRLVHLVPDAPPLEVLLPDETILLTETAYRSGSAYVEMSPGMLQLRFRQADTTNIVYVLEDLPFEQGINYSIYLAGLVGEGTLQAFVVCDGGNSGS